MLPVLLLAAVSLSCSNLGTDLTDALNSEGAKYYAYAASSSSNKIIGYILNSETGTLTLNGSAEVNNPTALATDPSGKYLYAASSGTNTITAYSIGSDGELTSSGSTKSTGADPVSIAVTQSGKYLYVMNKTDNTISAYSIDPSTGGLTPVIGGSAAAGSSPWQIAVDPAGKWLYAANYGSNNIYAYDINSSTGALSAFSGNPVLTATQPSSIAIAPSGAFAYIANWGTAINSTSFISAYSINSSTGALSFNQNIDASATLNLYLITVHPSGKYLYAAVKYNGTKAIAYEIGSTGMLTRINESELVTGNGPNSIAIDPTGKYLFITDNIQNQITVLSIESKGALTYLKKVTLGGATAIVFVKK